MMWACLRNIIESCHVPAFKSENEPHSMITVERLNFTLSASFAC